MIHLNKCPLCSSENTGHYLLTCDNFLSREFFELIRCAGCGFIFTRDHPGEAEAGRYYESDEYLSHNDSAKGLSAVLYRLTRNFMLRRKRSIVNNFTVLKKGTLLDIGSGTGHFLSEMKNAGWTASGIEINEKAREFSVSETGVQVIPPEMISSLSSESFDCITMWHVLEHFQEPFEYASEVFRLLKPGGSWVVALPNCSSYDALHYREYWAAYDVPRHLWHFTPATFNLFANKAGFKVKSTRSLPLDVFYISALSEKYKGSKHHLLKGLASGLRFAIMSAFQKDKSSSLIYLLKK
jgi:ubiquinone/menaquinone biosynthesis C-methylase UbiE